MTSFRWAKKAACSWLSLLTSADLKWISRAPGALISAADSRRPTLAPRFPEPGVLARLELGVLLPTEARRRS